MGRGRPSKYTTRQRFMIEVLHLHGLSAEGVARIMTRYGVPMTLKAAQGMIYRLPNWNFGMPAAVRQRRLDALKKDRQDCAYGQPGLPDEFFVVRSE